MHFVDPECIVRDFFVASRGCDVRWTHHAEKCGSGASMAAIRAGAANRRSVRVRPSVSHARQARAQGRRVQRVLSVCRSMRYAPGEARAIGFEKVRTTVSRDAATVDAAAATNSTVDRECRQTSTRRRHSYEERLDVGLRHAAPFVLVNTAPVIGHAKPGSVVRAHAQPVAVSP